jgi:hypothetical protein
VNCHEAQEVALDNLSAAQDRLVRVRSEWVQLGEPTLAEGGATGSAPVAHPLLRELRELEKHVAELRKLLWPGQTGRPAESVPGWGPPPSQIRRGQAA